MRRVAVAIAFLTRLPVPGAPALDAAEVGRAAMFFPAVGALLGGLLAVAARILSPRLTPTLAAALLVALLALLTGALHLDGLADTADGFGGGRTAEDVLRIMRDHAVGAFGATALVITLGVKVAAIAALVDGANASTWLLLAPALARWTPVALGYFLPYARPEGGLGTSVTGRENGNLISFVGATVLALGLAVAAARAVGLIAFAAVAAYAAAHGLACRQRIGGVTGDTLGAAIEISETLVLVLGVALHLP